MVLYIPYDTHESDLEKLDFHNGDISKLLDKLKDYKDDMDNSCTLAFSFEIMIDLLSNITIEYGTEDAFYYQHVLYIDNVDRFCELCKYNRDDNNVLAAWLGVLQEISSDIDCLEHRYGYMLAGEFLRSLLVYFAQIRLLTVLN